jgi:hypothetical protein
MKTIASRLLLLTLLLVACSSTCKAKSSNRTTKKLQDTIWQKVYDNLYKNYYTDSVLPVSYSEYIFVAESNHLLSAVFITGYGQEPWLGDYRYVQQRYGYCFRVPRYWEARMFEEAPNIFYGLSRSFVLSSYAPFRDDAISCFVRVANLAGKERRATAAKNAKKGKAANFAVDLKAGVQGKVKASFTVGGTQFLYGDSAWVSERVDEIIYNDEPCYKLTTQVEMSFLFDEKAQAQLEKMIAGGTLNKNLRTLAYFWGSKREIETKEVIINKADYAIVSYVTMQYVENGSRERFVAEFTEENFVKDGLKYRQQLYKSLALLFDANRSIYRNNQGIYSYIVKRPLPQPYPSEKLTDIDPVVRIGKGRYEAFCTRVSEPDDRMLEEWNNFIRMNK